MLLDFNCLSETVELTYKGISDYLSDKGNRNADDSVPDRVGMFLIF